MDLSKYSHKIFSDSIPDFDDLALDVFRFQYEKNTVYREYVNALGADPKTIRSIANIPFLPIRFFKSHLVQTSQFEPAITFESSGTTGSTNSRHFVKDPALYQQSFLKGFELAYGAVTDWCIIGLLPSYLEKGNSSLVYMVDELIKKTGHAKSGFYLNDTDRLYEVLLSLEKAGEKTILIGVTFALLDFAERYEVPLRHTIIMETGGMKGRREEMVRAEVHDVLKRSFSVPAIHSEYGMTELFSQAYSGGNGLFHCPPWMKLLIREESDPLSVVNGQFADGSQQPEVVPVVRNPELATRGGINIIDLANIHSCCFIATDDAGKLYNDGSFEVLGRMDNSDIRGCSLMTV